MQSWNPKQNLRKGLSGIGRKSETVFYRANRGSAAVEACIALPVFLFSVFLIFQMLRLEETKAVLYEAVCETTEYLAEYTYLKKKNPELAAVPDQVVAELKFREYLDDKRFVDTYVKGGRAGVLFPTVTAPDEDGMVEIHYAYILNVSAPFFTQKNKLITGEMRQSAYLGDEKRRGSKEYDWEDCYVYVTENREVFHTTRCCSYLELSIHSQGKRDALIEGFQPCHFCGGSAEEVVFITEEGGRYHSTLSCSGLKRTVQRIKKSETGGLPPCSRCGGY